MSSEQQGSVSVQQVFLDHQEEDVFRTGGAENEAGVMPE